MDIQIYNKDLTKHKYSIEVLLQNINHLSLNYIVVTQTLTADFCVEHILSHESHGEDFDRFDKQYILHYQPHISKEEYEQALEKYMNRNHY
jgi:hypothetical protein